MALLFAYFAVLLLLMSDPSAKNIPERMVKKILPPPTNGTLAVRKEPAFKPPATKLAVSGPCKQGSGRDANGDCVSIFK